MHTGDVHSEIYTLMQTIDLTFKRAQARLSCVFWLEGVLNRRTRCLVGGNMFDSHVCTTCRPGHRRLSLFIILSFSLNHIACSLLRKTHIHPPYPRSLPVTETSRSFEICPERLGHCRRGRDHSGERQLLGRAAAWRKLQLVTNNNFCLFFFF